MVDQVVAVGYNGDADIYYGEKWGLFWRKISI